MPIQITISDVIDIFLIAFLLFQLYRLIKGTPAFSIFIAVSIIYLFWLLVKLFNLELTSTLFGQVIGVGVIALIVVFQQEIRRFLIVFGNRYIKSGRLSGMIYLFSGAMENISHRNSEEVVRAIEAMSERRTGALIVVARSGLLEPYSNGGEKLDARISAELIVTIFTKSTPLHDGAVLIENGRIMAARCPLPITERINISNTYGMRHRAALGMSEHTDALVIVVSEETGTVSIADAGTIKSNLSVNELRQILAKEKI